MSSLLHQAVFSTSAAQISQLPPDDGFEVAFGGRSNAGKSSALNRLTRQKSLARTSKTPGRTQLINVFECDAERRLIDLPGYGFAKVPEKVRRQWGDLIGQYLTVRGSLQGMILLMDARRPLTSLDQQMVQWSEDNGLPTHILLTKADKLSKGAANNERLKVQNAVKNCQTDITVQLFSSLKGTGIEEANEKILSWLNPNHAG